MIIVLDLILLTSLWVLGIRIVTSEGMAMEKFGSWCSDKSDKHKVFKALCSCHWCMPSCHSLVGYAIAFGIGILTKLSWNLLFMYPIVVAGSSLTCGMIWSFNELMSSKKDYYDMKLYNENKKSQNGNEENGIIYQEGTTC